MPLLLAAVTPAAWLLLQADRAQLRWAQGLSPESRVSWKPEPSWGSRADSQNFMVSQGPCLPAPFMSPGRWESQTGPRQLGTASLGSYQAEEAKVFGLSSRWPRREKQVAHVSHTKFFHLSE